MSDGFSIKQLLDDVEKHFIKKALKESSSRAAAARLLGYESGAAMKYRQEALDILAEE
jgi:hypothetical protein